MSGHRPDHRPGTRSRPSTSRSALRGALHLATVLALGAAGCGDDGESLDEATVRLTLTGTGTASVVTGLAEGSPSPDLLHAMSCTFGQGTCEASEDLGDDITAAQSIQLTVTAQPVGGTTLVGWSGDCTAMAGTPGVATLTLGAEKTYTCSAEFEGPPAGVTTFADGFSAIDDNWEVVLVGAFNGGTIFWQDNQGNPGGNFGGEQSLGEWLYAINTGATYTPIATGAVDSIVYEEDRRIVVPGPEVTTASLGAVVAIRQGATISTARLPGDVNGQFQNREWQTRRAVLRASDFTPQPDFSAAGATMELGLGRRDEWRSGTLIQYSVDNWKVSVYHH